MDALVDSFKGAFESGESLMVQNAIKVPRLIQRVFDMNYVLTTHHPKLLVLRPILMMTPSIHKPPAETAKWQLLSVSRHWQPRARTHTHNLRAPLKFSRIKTEKPGQNVAG